MAELKDWCGHIPRDRGSIWYLVPMLGWAPAALLLAILALVVAGA